jgi:dihydroorotate dehydrogenase electron transfer subunit
LTREIQTEAGLHRARVLENRFLSPLYFEMVLERPGDFPDCRPGQFVHARVTDDYAPLLRRPFSLLDVTDSRLLLLLKVVGRGTRVLSEKRPGTVLDLLGPLGSAFPEPEGDGGRIVLVGGGVGLAPLYFLAAERERRGLEGGVDLYFGAGTERDLLPELLERLSWNRHLATLDGSRGFRGNCVELLEANLDSAASGPAASAVYGCGPRGMLGALVSSLSRNGRPLYVSMEENMGCGMGACRGCSLPTPAGTYLTTCTHGPVFRAEELDWGAVACA